MARLTDAELTEVLQPHLAHGERLKHWALGVKQPSLLIVVPLCFLALLPGLIAMQLLSKFYVAGLTDRRLLILRYSGRLKVQEVSEYRLSQLPPVQVAMGSLFTKIRIRDAAKPFLAKFGRAFKANNHEHARAIALELQGNSVPATTVPQYPRPDAGPVAAPARLAPEPKPVVTAAGPEPRAPHAMPSVATAEFVLRVGGQRIGLRDGARLHEDHIAGLIAKSNDGWVAQVDRNPADPAVMGLKNLSTSAWRATLPSGEQREVTSGRAIRLDAGTEIDFGFCNGVVET